MKNRYITIIYILFICILSAPLTSCAEEEEGADVPVALLGTWGLTEKQDSKQKVPVLQISAARVVIGGIYFDIRRVDDVDYTHERNFTLSPSRYPYSHTGSLYTRGPGAAGLLSQYRLSRDRDTLYLDGGEILSGALPKSLSKLD